MTVGGDPGQWYKGEVGWREECGNSRLEVCGICGNNDGTNENDLVLGPHTFGNRKRNSDCPGHVVPGHYGQMVNICCQLQYRHITLFISRCSKFVDYSHY